MGIALSDATIPPMDEELSPLVLGDLPGCLDRLALGLVDGASAAATGPTHCPSVLVRHYVLIASCHFNLPLVKYLG